MKWMLSQMRAVLTVFLMIINTIFWMVPLFIFGALKFILQLVPPVRQLLNKAITYVCLQWNCFNKNIIDMTQNITWDIIGNDNLVKEDSYLVISNHQSWVDILVLVKVLIKKIPFIKFFIKEELKWIPVLGFAWWALDYPFMKRYSKDFLKKNPHLKGKDLEQTRKACEKFKFMPVTVMNFVEGTRFTQAKHEHQKSPYKHLLRPKAGGTALVLAGLGDKLKTLLNVTIYYPQGVKTIWQFFCGEVKKVVVRIEKSPITDRMIGDYFNDHKFQKQFQEWLNLVWNEKDALLEELHIDQKTNSRTVGTNFDN